MTKKYDQYTYRAGKKIQLRKSQDELVVRQVPEELAPDEAIERYEQVSSSSTRLKTSASQLEGVMSRSRAAAPTHHAYYEENGDAAFLITDRVFSSFHEPPSDVELGDFLARYGLVLLERYSDRDFLFQLTNHTGINPVKLVVRLNDNDDMIESAEHDLNHQVHKYQVPVPTDPGYVRQWHLHTNFNHVDYDQRSCAMCEEAWQLLDNYGSSSITVAISDDGCRTDHSDFDSPDKFSAWGYFESQRLLTPEDFDADMLAMYKPGANHGTSCAGVVAGETDAQRVVGAAPGCRLLPIMFESSGPSLFVSSSRMLKVLNYIADRADIMSNSWGNVPVNVWPTLVVNRMAGLARTGGPRGKGILFLWAAGNENCPIDLASTVDIPYTSGIDVVGNTPYWVGVQTARNFENNLVGIPGLMHIAAIASNARRSHYSNYGPGIGLCSPTSNVHTYSRMVVRGLGITSTTGSGDGVTDSFGGTSSATPLVAGVAALVRSANPNLTAAEVESVLKQTASKNLDFTGYPQTAPAPFNTDTSWDVSPVPPFDDGTFGDTGSVDGTWSPWFGYGRLDARAAVAEALNRLVTTGAAHFDGSSAPNISIPDKSLVGVSDTINCGKVFTVETVKVRVDITHTYSGDLKVSLVSPSGLTIPIHNRAGGSAHDIHADFDSTSVPQLIGHTGDSSFGEWRLLVQDLAAVDVGRLQSWSIQLRGSNLESVVVSESPGLIIPDNQSPGVERSLNVASAITISSIGVSLDITHTYVSDLRVSIAAPDGTTVTLHNRSGGDQDNIIREFTPINTPAMQTLLGRNSMGDWTLSVTDHANLDQGKLNHWQLMVS